VPNQPMSNQDIADIVGWLAAHRNAANVAQDVNANPGGTPNP